MRVVLALSLALAAHSLPTAEDVKARTQQELKIIDAQYGKAESDGDSAKVRLSLIETPAARPQPSPC